jgi:hypothetical protein
MKLKQFKTQTNQKTPNPVNFKEPNRIKDLNIGKKPNKFQRPKLDQRPKHRQKTQQITKTQTNFKYRIRMQHIQDAKSAAPVQAQQREGESREAKAERAES